MSNPSTGIAGPSEWRAAAQAARRARAEPLRLPSGTTILAVRPEPLEWIIAGRIPQKLLSVALENSPASGSGLNPELGREEILDLARFAAQLVRASVVEPPLGDAPGEMPLEEIPIEDRAFLFEWACRALGDGAGTPSGDPQSRTHPAQEDLSIPPSGMERFRQK